VVALVGNGGVRLLAFDVSDSANPQLTSSLTFNPNAPGFQHRLRGQGMIYFSHDNPTFPGTGRAAGRSATSWDVILIRRPESSDRASARECPRQLAGVSDDGAMLYLLGNALSAAGLPYESRDAVNACAYDE